MPLVMLGTFIGVQINEILPETLVFILLFVTLLYLTYKAFVKAIDAYKKEKKIAQEKKEQKDEERVPLRDATRNINGTKENVGSREDMFQPLMQHNDKDKLSQTHDNGSGPLDIKLNPLRQSVRENSRQSIARGERIENDTQGIENEDKELLIGERRSTYKLDELNSKLKMYLKLEKSHFRIRTILVVLLPFLTITIFALLRGTKTFDSIAGPRFGRCTVSDYIFLAAEIIILFILSGVNIMLLKREYQDKLSCGYQFVKGDIVWDSKSIVRFVLFAIIAGFISGAVGLSGGILFTPLFLDFGVPPTVASGTSMFMAMFATLSSTIMFMFNGYIIYDFAFWLAFFSVVGTAAGITIIGGAVKKSGKTQILVWLLAFVILASCIADGVVGLLETIDTPKGEMFKFRSYCPEDKANMFMYQ
uniref:Sulfite exporter TauE/SafE family protein n=1 Tax=Euplotes crassus TaxID=5936 RepID=A0A7S3NXP4_EUPCR|mmetsp:Transcript_5018/g.4805  ORF Transcript_5018/g.4805 Transcript_5018/m.4805 type:complete len:419 (+) Transcript_5018:458-1714(+)